MLCGDKTFAPGHKIRHDIWNKQNYITIPKNFINQLILKI